MNKKKESTMAVLAAILVIFTTMLNPFVSAGIAAVLFFIFAIYKSGGSKK